MARLLISDFEPFVSLWTQVSVAVVCLDLWLCLVGILCLSGNCRFDRAVNSLTEP